MAADAAQRFRHAARARRPRHAAALRRHHAAAGGLLVAEVRLDHCNGSEETAGAASGAERDC